METLGLASTREREDNFFQRLFWPTIRNQYDVDLTSRRGFWLAFVVGLLSGVVMLVQHQPWLAIFTVAVFLLGAAGIRQLSFAAAVLVFALYFTGVVIQWVAAFMGLAHTGNPFVTMVCLGLLLSCIRATALSRQFAAHGDVEFPEGQRSPGMLDRIVDGLPPAVWPKTRVVFFVLSGLYLVLTIAGAAVLLTHPQVAATSLESNR